MGWVVVLVGWEEDGCGREDLHTWMVAEREMGEGEERRWSGCLVLVMVNCLYGEWSI